MENNTLTSTSGFNQFPRGYKMAIIYNDDTCPYCGSSKLVPEYNTIETIIRQRELQEKALKEKKKKEEQLQREKQRQEMARKKKKRKSLPKKNV